MRTYYVYTLANRSRRLYTGVTGNIVQRVGQHRRGEVGSTRVYGFLRLVLVETTNDVAAAIAREKQIKGWSRAKKLALIRSMNPAWDDLAEGWSSD